MKQQSRRRLLAASAVGAGLAGLRRAAPLALLPLTPALARESVRTPAQSLGPFYPETIPAEHDSDLTRIGRGTNPAKGEVAHVSGNVFGPTGQPVKGVLVEIWQCDANGRYHHPRDAADRPLDANFQGYGRMLTDDGGGYAFRTIKPVPYPGRTPHIHFRLSGPTIAELVTQMYIAGHPLNERDGLLQSVRDARARDSLLAIFRPVAGTAEWTVKWDIVVDVRGSARRT